MSPGPFLNPAVTPYNASASSALVNIVPIPGPSTALMTGLGLICFLSRARAFGEIEWDEICVALPDLRNGAQGFERDQSENRQNNRRTCGLMDEKMPSLNRSADSLRRENEASSRKPKDCDIAAGTNDTLLCVVGEGGAMNGFISRLWLAIAMVCGTCIFMAPAASAQNIVLLTPFSQSIELEDPSVTVDLEIDFADITVGGGVEVTYDATRLSFDSFEFEPGLEFLLVGPEQGAVGQPLVIGAGLILFTPPFGVSGLQTIGTLTFTPVAAGEAFVQTSASSVFPGPFASPGSGAPLPATFSGATIDVPEPGFATGLVIGAILLFVMRERWAYRSANMIS